MSDDENVATLKSLFNLIKSNHIEVNTNILRVADQFTTLNNKLDSVVKDLSCQISSVRLDLSSPSRMSSIRRTNESKVLKKLLLKYKTNWIGKEDLETS